MIHPKKKIHRQDAKTPRKNTESAFLGALGALAVIRCLLSFPRLIPHVR
jgi:hypothetical protein